MRVISLLLLLLIVFIVQAANVVQLLQLSVDPALPFGKLTGSVNGGTNLYIRALGLDPILSNNQVLIGPYPCQPVDIDSSAQFLSCRTSQATDSDQLTDLDIRVSTKTKRHGLCKLPNCRFSYLESITVVVSALVPRTALPQSRISVLASHLTEGVKLSQINMKMNDVFCQYGAASALGSYSGQTTYLPCQLLKKLKIADASFSYSYLTGDAIYSPRLLINPRQPGSAARHFTVVPQITSISSYDGSTYGNLLTVSLKGATSNISVYSCSVAGEVCTVLSVSNEQLQIQIPALSIDNRQFGRINSSSSTDPLYVSSGGVHFTKYNCGSLSLGAAVTAIRTAQTSCNLLSSEMRAEIYSDPADSSAFTELHQGYFLAEASGNYSFRTNSDDSSAVYIAAAANSSVDALTMVASLSGYSSSAVNPYILNQASQTGSIYLSQGYHYFEVYHQNVGGKNHLSVAVETVNNDSSLSVTGPEVQLISYSPSQIIPEILNVSIESTGGSFRLSYVASDSTVSSTADIPFNATDDQFKSSLGKLPCFGSKYKATFVNASTTNNLRTWIIQYNSYRSISCQLPLAINTTSLLNPTSAQYAQVQSHSDPVKGTFRLAYGAVPIAYGISYDIPYNIPAVGLQNIISESLGSPFVEVEMISSTTYEDGPSFMVSFLGNSGSQQTPTINTSGLSGGKPDSYVVGSVKILRKGTNNEYYPSLPYHLLYQLTNISALTISQNGVLAVCQKCTYSYNQSKTPIVSSFVLSQNILKINLSASSPLAQVVSDYKIMIAGKECGTASGQVAQPSCTLPGSVQLRAGNHIPKVYIPGVGNSTANQNVIAWQVPLTVTSVSPATGSPAGGLLLTVNGAGLPNDLNDASSAIASFCGIPGRIVSANNQQMTVIVPTQSCGRSATMSLSFGGYTVPLPFSYSQTAPMITSLSVYSSSPAQNVTLCVSGNSFGLNVSAVHLLMTRDPVVYNLQVINVTGNILCGYVAGGTSGTYEVIVLVDGIGYSRPTGANNNIYTLGVFVDSVSPLSGPIGGGTLINITGRNFVGSGNEVYVGSNVCTIVSQSPILIQCLTPAATNLTEQSVTVVVRQRSTQVSLCQGLSCNFMYSTAESYLLNQLSTTVYRTGDNITLTGSNIQQAIVHIGGVPCMPLFNTDTQIVVAMPSLPYGNYSVRVEGDNGFAHPNVSVSNVLSISSFSALTGSDQGNKITVYGEGLPNSTADNALSAILNCNSSVFFDLTVVRSASTSNMLEIPLGKYQYCEIVFTYRDLTVKSAYSVVPAQTPNTTLSPQIVNASSDMLSFTVWSNDVPATAYNISGLEFSGVDENTNNNGRMYFGVRVSQPNLTSQIFNVSLPCGKYSVRAFVEGYGYGKATLVSVTFANVVAPAKTVSYNGGALLELSGVGFDVANIQANRVTVCGVYTEILNATSLGLTVVVPGWSIGTSNKTAQPLKGKWFSDANGTLFGRNPFDGNIHTSYSSAASACYFGLDFGEGNEVRPQSVSYIVETTISASGARMFQGAALQGSSDFLTWQTLYVIGNEVFLGRNNIRFDAISHGYRYIRFSHNSTSSCRVAEMTVRGNYFTANSSTRTCSIIVESPAGDVTLASALTYQLSKAVTVNAITPLFGSTLGGTTLTISGSNFGASIIVSIDGSICAIVAYNSTLVTCITSPKVAPRKDGFKFLSDGQVAALPNQVFAYANFWSSGDYWPGESAPRQGDDLVVKVGTALLVDISTPSLNRVTVHGTLIFSDGSDIIFASQRILVSATGRLVAGSAYQPRTRTLTLLTTNLQCRGCQLQLYGNKLLPTWTKLSSTSAAGATSISLSQRTNWTVGSEVLVCSTQASYDQSQIRAITGFSGQNRALVLNESLKYQHISTNETYNNQTATFRAEVALLTRTIVIAPNFASEFDGVAVLVTKIDQVVPTIALSHVQLEKCGQRSHRLHCIDVRVSDSMAGSKITGVSIRNSFARGISIDGASDLAITENVVVNASGGGITLNRGSEVRNNLTSNVIVGTANMTYLDQVDVLATGIAVQNPFNNITFNAVASSEYDGLTYRGTKVAQDSLAIAGACPIGTRIMASTNNNIHSCTNNGVSIVQMAPSGYPCEVDFDLPTGYAPSANTLSNYTVWGNLAAGFYGLKIGAIQLQNFTFAQNGKSAVDVCSARLSSSGMVLETSTVISTFTNQTLTPTLGLSNSTTVGIYLPNAGGIALDRIFFSNFGSQMTVLSFHASACDSLTTSLMPLLPVLTTSGLQFSTIAGKYFDWAGQDTASYDKDGSLGLAATSVNSTGGWFMPYSTLANSCRNTTSPWDSSVFCSSPATVRKIRIFSVAPKSLNTNASIMVHNVPSSVVNRSYNAATDGWSANIIVNREYDMFWSRSDFSQLRIQGQGWAGSEAALFNFNYTSRIDNLTVVRYLSASQSETASSVPSLLMSNCSNGDYSWNPTNSTISVCIRGIAAASDTNTVVVKPQRCVSNCDSSPGRMWSLAGGWPSGIVPQADSNVTIRQDEVVVLDVDPPALLYVLVMGRLIFSSNSSRVLKASYIEVRGGSLEVGSAAQVYTNSAIIEFVAPPLGRELLFEEFKIDNSCGLLVSSGSILLYGQVPLSVGTRLTTISNKGTRRLTVGRSNDWRIGDQIAIGPSYSGQSEGEFAVVAAINSSTIELDRSLEYEHYGDTSVTVNNSYGSIDTRSIAARLTRNIQVRSSNLSASPCRIVVAGTASVVFNSVELSGLGSDTAAALTITSSSGRISIKSSSIHHCLSDCVNLINSRIVNISQNVFYNGQGRLVYAQRTTNLTVASNIFVSARMLPSSSSIAVSCVAINSSLPVTFDNFVEVLNNSCQGSQGSGFALPHLPCSDILQKSWFRNNSAGSCMVGFLFLEAISPAVCIGGGSFAAYACSIGALMNPQLEHSTIQYSNFMISDCSRALTLRSSFDSGDNTAIVTNSYMSGYSRPNCVGCYGDLKISGCKDGFAVRMFTATTTESSYDNPNIDLYSYDSIRSRQALDSKAYFENVTFENYLYYNRLLPFCSGMSVFRRHVMAADSTASHYLTNTQCINCQARSLARFEPPSSAWLGSFGGCGSMQCTGANNYFVQDKDGDFLGFIGQLLANNSWIGEGLSSCSFNDRVNGYFCGNTTLAVLEYQSLAADSETRRVWPVETLFLSRNFSTSTNAWRRESWGWGNTQKIIRPSLFLTVLELNSSYQLTYEGDPPTNSIYQLQKRDYQTDRMDGWVILQLKFPPNHSLNVYSVKNTLGGSTETLVEGIISAPLETSLVCGQNSVDFPSGTVRFLITNYNECAVRVESMSYILLTFTLDIDLLEFNNRDGSQNMKVVLATALAISASRIQVRSLREGSTIGDVSITAISNSSVALSELNQINSQVKDLLMTSQLQFLARVISYSSTLNIVGEQRVAYEIKDIQPAVKGLFVVAGLLGVVALASIFVYRHLKIKNAAIHPEESFEVRQEKIKVKEGYAEKASELPIADDLRFND